MQHWINRTVNTKIKTLVTQQGYQNMYSGERRQKNSNYFTDQKQVCRIQRD